MDGEGRVRQPFHGLVSARGCRRPACAVFSGASRNSAASRTFSRRRRPTPPAQGATAARAGSQDPAHLLFRPHGAGRSALRRPRRRRQHPRALARAQQTAASPPRSSANLAAADFNLVQHFPERCVVARLCPTFPARVAVYTLRILALTGACFSSVVVVQHERVSTQNGGDAAWPT